MVHSEETKEVFAALAAAQAKFRGVPKSGQNTAQKYAFADTNDYLQTVRDILAEHGLAITSSVVEMREADPVVSKSGYVQRCTRVKMITMLIHQSGQWMQAVSFGEGLDPGDKGIYKATTGARKYGLACLLGLATSDDPEGDEGTDRAVKDAKPARPADGKKNGSAKDKLATKAQIDRLRSYLDIPVLEDKQKKYIKDMVGDKNLTKNFAGVVIGKISKAIDLANSQAMKEQKDREKAAGPAPWDDEEPAPSEPDDGQKTKEDDIPW